MSESPRYQLGLFGGEEPVTAVEAVKVAEDLNAKPPRREVSAERAMLAAQASLAISMDPPDIEGWREELGRERPRIVNGVCTAIERDRRQADGTIGPCPWLACENHLLFDYGEPVTIGGRRYAEVRLNRAGAAEDDAALGRRPGLPTVPTDGEVDDFALLALRRLEELPDTCRLDVQARDYSGAYQHAHANGAEITGQMSEWQESIEAPVMAIAVALGLSEEQVRLDTLSGTAAIGVGMHNGSPVPAHPEVAEEILRQASQCKPKIRRTWRGKVGTPPPAPAAIVREERDAPPVRERSADEIFTF